MVPYLRLSHLRGSLNIIIYLIHVSLAVFPSSFLLSGRLAAQDTITGTKGYITYHKGHLPIVLSVAHGGTMAPASIPDRICDNAETVTDKNTIELAESISEGLFLLTGYRPYIIRCNLKRSKADCNRDLEEAACGNAEAETAWREFRGFIEQALSDAAKKFGDHVFYLDIHGHAHTIRRIELGYLLYGSELRMPDDSLDQARYINYSSIRDLVNNNQNNYTHSELLRGALAFGTFLADSGYPSVPSLQDPFPHAGESYFSGGYNIARHTSYQAGSRVNGVQMECYYTGIRDTKSNRDSFGLALAEVLTTYFWIHRNIDLKDLSPMSIRQASTPSFTVFPNPSSGQAIHIKGGGATDGWFRLSDPGGKTMEEGSFVQGSIQLSRNYQPGIYILSIRQDQTTRSFKVLLL